jgi:hypothetical protein
VVPSSEAKRPSQSCIVSPTASEPSGAPTLATAPALTHQNGPRSRAARPRPSRGDGHALLDVVPEEQRLRQQPTGSVVELAESARFVAPGRHLLCGHAALPRSWVNSPRFTTMILRRGTPTIAAGQQRQHTIAPAPQKRGGPR